MIRIYKNLNESSEDINDVPLYTAINFRCPEFDIWTNSHVPGSKIRKGIVINNPSLRPDRGQDYVDVAKGSSQICASAKQSITAPCPDCSDCVELDADDLSWQINDYGEFRQFQGTDTDGNKITTHLFRPDMTGDICSIKKGIKVEQQETIISNTVISKIKKYNIDGPYFRDKTDNGIRQHFTTIHAAPNNDATSDRTDAGWDISERYQQQNNKRLGGIKYKNRHGMKRGLAFRRRLID